MIVMFVVVIFIYVCVGYISYQSVDLNLNKEKGLNSDSITIYEANHESLTYSYKYNIQLVIKNGYVDKIKLLAKEKAFFLLKEHRFTVYHDYSSIRLETFKATMVKKRIALGNVVVDYGNPEVANQAMTEWSAPFTFASTKTVITNVEFMLYNRVTASEIIDSLNKNEQLFKIVIK